MMAATVGIASANPIEEPIIDRGFEVELAAVVQIPNSSRGIARLNHFATTGDRLFVVEDFDGRIYEITSEGQGAQAELFFDVKAAIAEATPRQLDNTSIFHGGVRAVAFHPEFASNGLLYTSQMETRSPDLTDDLYLSNVENPAVADGVVIEWRVDVATGEVDPNSYRQVFRVGIPDYDHPIKQIAFNSFAQTGDEDFGLLYVAHGDGSAVAAERHGGQDNDALGKILRVDPTLQANEDRFGVPASNPFVDDPDMLDEVYSLGHRNPHNLSFASDGQLIVAEIGRDNVEEINLIQPGGNYGWGLREGTFVHVGAGLETGIAPLAANEADNGFVFPAAQWGHVGEAGQAIAGSHVIENGSDLDGEYLHADFAFTGELFHSNYAEMSAAVTSLAPGQAPTALTQAAVARPRILFDHDANPATEPLERENLRDVFDDAPTYDGFGRADVRFGQGPDGELYISSKRNGLVYLVTNSVRQPDAPTATAFCEGREVTVNLQLNPDATGTDGDDVILGTAGSDTIDSLGGADVICGAGGGDVINAGPGDDIVFGGEGDDRIDAGSGADFVFGGDGDDVVNAGSGDDVVFGDAGDDAINAGRGTDNVSGNTGADVVSGGKGKDTLSGGAGNDELRGNKGKDTIRGGSGSDVLRGGQKADEITGGNGKDALFGGNGADALDGGGGVDTYNGGGGVNDVCLADPSGGIEETEGCESR